MINTVKKLTGGNPMANPIDGLTINSVTYDFTLSAATALEINTIKLVSDPTDTSKDGTLYTYSTIARTVSDKTLTLNIPSATSTTSKTLATTDNGTLSVNGSSYTLSSATKPSIYTATSAISTTTSKRYLLGSSSQTGMSTTSTNASCYMQSNILYSNGRKTTNILTGTSTTSTNNATERNTMRIGFTNLTLYIWVE